MKRKSDEINGGVEGETLGPVRQLSKKHRKASVEGNIQKNFRQGLFADEVLSSYTKDYAQSEPYRHAVICELMNDALLRKVRSEIRENVHFTPKQTDIYKIHQSGDLANLDGLDDAALAKLPSLLKLRDSLYSPIFRKYVAAITNSGDLSGRKTDMAINVYTPGCHLLCHDDVIGSRRVSYILYLTDPDIPWKDEWGGALRLYPTTSLTGVDGEITKTPSPQFSKAIPPAWNQLSFFAVQPGESFHDVEEVYHAASSEIQEKDGGRVRMAISGWYHIPQVGEDGYIEGAEEKLAEKSSLVQLQGKADRYDFPQEIVRVVDSLNQHIQSSDLNAEDIDFLLKYMSPTYLTPDTLEQVAAHFSEQSSITLDEILSKKFSARLRKYIEDQEKSILPTSLDEIEKNGWKVARPPHKHRFLYLQDTDTPNESTGSVLDPSPIHELLHTFLPSREFRQWLQLATQCGVKSHSVIARRFRRGLDYSLATSHEGEPRLELSLSLTPTKGWGGDTEDEGDDLKNGSNGDVTTANGKEKPSAKVKVQHNEEDESDVGGHEVYMAGDDDTDGDAAVYKASTDPDDDNVLFAVPASWNKISIVLRDSGVLKFVKYVSKAAKGDRWDVAATYGVTEEDEDEDEDKEDREKSQEQVSTQETQVSLESMESSGEEEFTGFPESEDSDSD